jgi:cyclophilin family peptidyl-prolyl cis-trans isomerase
MRRQSTRFWRLVNNLVKPAPKRRPYRNHRRLQLEFLEDRLTPSTTNLTNLNLGVISGVVYVDPQDLNQPVPGDMGVPGVQISLTGTTTSNQQVNQTATTDSHGDYFFYQLQPGTYQVSRSNVNNVLGNSISLGNLGGTPRGQTVTNIDLAQGQVGLNYDFAVRGLAAQAISLADFLTTSTSTPIATDSAGTGVDFADGLDQPASAETGGTAALGGRVFNNSTGAGIAGAEVILTGVDYFGKAFAFGTTSAANGSYQFTGLQPGDYTLDLLQPTGYRSLFAGAGSLGGITPLNDQVTGIQVAAGQIGSLYGFAEIASNSPTSGPGPAVVAELADDTGSSPTDGITSDPTIQGSVHTSGTLTSVVATVDGKSSTINVLPLLNSAGDFLLNPAQLQQAAGSRLANGAHTVTVTASDSAGRTSTVTVHFTLDSTAPPAPNIDFGGSARLGGLGSNVHVAKQAANSIYSITGTAAAGSTVDLLGLGQPLVTTADSSGKFTFGNVKLTSIVNELTAVVMNTAGDYSSATAEFVLDNNPTSKVIAPQTLTKTQTNGTTLNLSTFFSTSATTDTTVQYNTSSGPIRVDLFNSLAPKTVANFLSYADSTTPTSTYTNSLFDRLIPNFVLQGGSFNFNPRTNTLTALSAGASIPSEASVPGAKTNVAGTLAMALPSGTNGQQYNVNGATSAYFFNLVNNPSLNGPFTVFGQVIDGQSMRVINTLAAYPTSDESSFSGALANMPLKNYTGVSFPSGLTSSNLAFISSISTAQPSESTALTFNASGFDTKVITATVSNGQLTIKPVATGTTSILVTATDQFGLTISQTFKVTVVA